MPEKIPLKARLSWFQVWVPVFLLLYLLVNGVGHGGSLSSLKNSWVLSHFLWGSGAMVTYPFLIVVAWIHWKLVIQFSPGVRWITGLVGFFLLCLFLFVQGCLLQEPFVGPPCLGNWPDQKKMLARQWKPHLSLSDLKPSVQEIAGGLVDPDAAVRGCAAEALGRRHAREFAPDILGLLHDPSPRVRVAAVRALGDLGDRKFVADIGRFLNDPDPRVCAAATDELGRLLHDPDPRMRKVAASALKRLAAPAP